MENRGEPALPHSAVTHIAEPAPSKPEVVARTWVKKWFWSNLRRRKKIEEHVDLKGKGKRTQEERCPEGIDCNCCFTEYPFETMIQCPEGHLFCTTCVVAYASNQFGLQDPKLKCMDQSGCSLLYSESELRRVLPEKLIALYVRLKQQKEIAEADLEGLEECPFCDYKCIMDVDKTQEKLFICRNYDGGCGAISCRECWHPEHIPKSCKEMDEDRKLNGQHMIEEAMSAAVMRICPKCHKPFIKEYGCNKITCYTCKTSSCYVCRKIVSGYDHFYTDLAYAPGTSKSPQMCPLWDTISVEARHAQEVKDAAEKAMEDVKSKNPPLQPPNSAAPRRWPLATPDPSVVDRLSLLGSATSSDDEEDGEEVQSETRKKDVEDQPMPFITVQATICVLILSVTAAAVIWRVIPQ